MMHQVMESVTIQTGPHNYTSSFMEYLPFRVWLLLALISVILIHLILDRGVIVKKGRVNRQENSEQPGGPDRDG